MDINNRFNEILPSFSSFNHKFSLGNRLIDIFPNCFSFHSLNRKSKNSIKNHLYNLKNITLQASSDPHIVVVISDVSIRNCVATSIVHVHAHNSPIIKMIHYIVNVMSAEVELFIIRCSINQATYLSNIKWIVIIIDSIYTAKRIFDSLSHIYQIYSAAISHELREFFE